MEGQEYLDQISRKSKPVKKLGGGKGILKSKFFIVGMIGVVGLLLIIILGSMTGGDKNSEKNSCLSLKLHLDDTAELINKYQTNVRSSNLRSSSASLYGIITNTGQDVTNYLTEKYKFKNNSNYKKTVSKKILDKATSAKDELDKELFSAKINGILDRIYAHKMAYEISLFIAEEGKLMNVTKNEKLKESLASSRQSLENLYASFNDFSETKPGGQ